MQVACYIIHEIVRLDIAVSRVKYKQIKMLYLFQLFDAIFLRSPTWMFPRKNVD